MNQTDKTYALLCEGWITSLECAQKGGCLSLSQRVSEWRRQGKPIEDKFIDLPSGARVKAYRFNPITA